MARRKKPSEDQPAENPDQNAGSDDTFGLPEIEYEPLNREATPAPHVVNPSHREAEVTQPNHIEEQPVTHTNMDKDDVHNENTSSYYNDEDEGNSPWPRILGIAVLLLVIGAAVWYFGFQRPKQIAAAKARADHEEQTRVDAASVEEERIAADRARQEEEQRKADSLSKAAPVAGTIETLNDRTGRYYVVIASAIDGDLIMDYAKKLNKKGVNARIIAPYGKVKFYRLAVAEGETFAATQQTADGLKGEYSDGAWVMKY